MLGLDVSGLNGDRMTQHDIFEVDYIGKHGFHNKIEINNNKTYSYQLDHQYNISMYYENIGPFLEI